MSYKIKPATAVKIQGYSFRSKNRDARIERLGLNAIHQKIKELETAEQKRNLISETNPFLYIFGEKLEVKYE